MKKFLIIFSFISIFSLCILRETTKSHELIKKFSIKRISDGDDENFPQEGDTVSVHYTGSFPDTGEVFDSSHSRKEALVFGIGHGYVIPCWDEVLQKMSKGEKIQIICPSNLAYGEAGAGKIIPPNKDLAFEIELIDFTRKVAEEVPTNNQEINQHQDL